ncbi:hypothetical protein HMPREF9423_0800 [Streptococcus infantis ATCC 700779]|uniref:Uncharacterized protein n=1 Tax=Streptococcus infantis ATCC 700779 TaxID=889204 RepID=E8JZY7_9STRE|nr:hypothetical protein HMPREF9423_0800 [Streptococcus infantis ATCC 700779]
MNERENEKSEGSFSNRIEGKNQSNSSSWASGYYSMTCYQSISEAGQIVVTFLEGIEVDL